MDWLKKTYLTVRSKISSRGLVLVIAIFVGVISIFPYFLAQVSIGDNYQGMPLLIQDSEGEYLGRVHELVEKHYSVASSVFNEYKDWPSLVPPTGEWIYFIPNYLFGISVVNVDMFYKFLLPALLFLLSYIFLLDMTGGSTFWAIIGSLVVTLGFDFTSVSFLKKLLVGDFFGYVSPWTRPVNPIIGMLSLSGYLILIYRIFVKKSRHYFFAGLILSFMIGYFFSFVYAGAFTALLLIFSLLFHNKSITFQLGAVLIIACVGVISLLGPSILSLVSGHAIGWVNDPRFQGLFYTRLPLLNKTSLIFTLIFAVFTFLIYFYRKHKIWLEDWWIFCVLLLVTNQIVFNIQIILGWTVWPQHFSQYTNIILVLIFVVFLARGIVLLFPRMTRFFGWLILVLVILLLVKTLPYNQDILPVLINFQKERPIMDWLNKQNISNCVVLVVENDAAELGLNRFIPAFTNCDVYTSYHIYQGVPRDRVFHNLLVWLWMRGVTEKELPQFLEKENFWIRASLFRDWRDMFCCGGDPWIAKLNTIEEWQNWYKGEEARVEEGYTAFLKQNPESELDKYKLSYVIVDKQSRVRKDLGSFKWLSLVYSDGRYDIYSFNK